MLAIHIVSRIQSATEQLPPKVFARVNMDAPVRGVFILLAVDTLPYIVPASDSLREQFEILVNLVVVTNVVPYVLFASWRYLQ